MPSEGFWPEELLLQRADQRHEGGMRRGISPMSDTSSAAVPARSSLWKGVAHSSVTEVVSASGSSGR
jgi:hypothetical protein